MFVKIKEKYGSLSLINADKINAIRISDQEHSLWDINIGDNFIVDAEIYILSSFDPYEQNPEETPIKNIDKLWKNLN